MKKIIFIILSFFFCLCTAHAQKVISGVVLDSASGNPMSKVSVKNLTTQAGFLTDYKGSFSVTIHNDDYIKISYVGYTPKVIRITDINDFDYLTIRLPLAKNNLKTIKVTRKLTQYQKDSIERAETYRKIIGYKQETSVMSPVSSIYQKFSKKHKNIRKIKEQMISMERQKFIDTKYVPATVQKITNLEGDSLAYFMNNFPMDYQFARTASELEIRLWIRYNWEAYKKKNKIKE